MNLPLATPVGSDITFLGGGGWGDISSTLG